MQILVFMTCNCFNCCGTFIAVTVDNQIIFVSSKACETVLRIIPSLLYFFPHWLEIKLQLDRGLWSPFLNLPQLAKKPCDLIRTVFAYVSVVKKQSCPCGRTRLTAASHRFFISERCEVWGKIATLQCHCFLFQCSTNPYKREYRSAV